jgi:uncharacterized protein (DUF362 family)/Pyruvate/2-oxoacid:ferredoxin oxidoreductase delta subunit
VSTTPTVSIARCNNYDVPQVYTAVKKSLEQVDGIHKLVGQKKKVLLKLNLLSSSLGPEHAVNTHPAVVRALVDFFQKDVGAEVYIGDSCGSVRDGSTNKAFKVTQLDKVTEDTGAKWVNFDKDKHINIKKSNGATLPTFRMARTVKDVDLVVSVPKLKTHGLTMYTGALKNTLGVIPAKGKKDVHIQAPKPAIFAQALVDVYEEVVPHLTLIDAIVGMEGNGPNAGNPRKVGLIIAGNNGVALDAVASSIIGYDPLGIPTIRYAQDRGLGTADLNKIDIKGERLEDVSIPDFKKPGNFAEDFAINYLPGFLFAKIFDVACDSYSTVYEPNCTKCYACIKNCPVQAITATGTNGTARVDKEKCIGCFCCDEVCDYKAIVMEKHTVGKIFMRIAKALGAERT